MSFSLVAPFVGAWIETIHCRHHLHCGTVAPFVGAWIETKEAYNALVEIFKSLPSWERGLKLMISGDLTVFVKSLPSWERGLKHFKYYSIPLSHLVAPFVGAWIETQNMRLLLS